MNSWKILYLLLLLVSNAFFLVKAIEESYEELQDNAEFTANKTNISDASAASNSPDSETILSTESDIGNETYGASTETDFPPSTEPPIISSTTIQMISSSEKSTSTTENITTSTEEVTVTTIKYPTFPQETTEFNNSTTEEYNVPIPEELRKPTWAIVLISLLLTFAALFSILYVFRKYIVRKRKADRQKLLSSTSQEGFFLGNDSDMGSL